MTEDIAYAIDFGTSNSVLLNLGPKHISEPMIIDDQQGLMKSLTYFLDDETYYHGRQAIQEYENHSFEGRFIRSIKKFLPDSDFKKTKIGERYFLIESIIGFFLKEMKERADKACGANVKKVLLGRPASYHIEPALDRLAQERMYRAATIAGFEEIDFFAEPLAAAMNFSNKKNWQNLFVVDIGAGTSDFTWLKRKSDKDYQVLAINSVACAGDSFDGDIMSHAIGKHFATKVKYSLAMTNNQLEMPQDIAYRLRSPADICFLSKGDISDFLNEIKKSTLNKEDKKRVENLEILLEDNLAYDLYKKIEESKILLANAKSHIFTYQYPDIEIKENLEAKRFEDWTEKTTEKIIKALEKTLEMAGQDKEEIDFVLLTGGSSKIPFLKDKIQTIFQEKEIISPEDFYSVALGLAVEAKKRFFKA